MRLVPFAFLIQFLSLAFGSANAQVLTFGAVNVGTAAPVQTLTYSFSSPTTLAAVNILTTGASGLDYTDGGNSNCTAENPYNAGDSCVVTVAFTPSAPGLRAGGVTLFAQGSTLPLMTWYLNGIGQSGAVTIDPGTQSTIATLSNGGQAYGLAIDGAGNVYVVDQANSQVIELAAGTFTQNTVVGSGLANPTAVALDGAGNLYISDTGNDRVVVVPNEQRGLNSGDMSTVSISSLGSPGGLATDGNGDLFVADGTNGNVIEIAAGGAQSTVASGLTSPTGVAVDAISNVYVASNNQVIELVYPGYSTTVAMGGGYGNPTGVAVDASGAVYVADSGNKQLLRVAPGGASQATLALTVLSSPQGLAVDGASNVYVADTGNVYELNRTQAAALAFVNTNVGSTSAPQTVTVSDAGNQPLTVSNLAITTNFTQVPSGGTDCTSSTQLSSAGQCLIAAAIAPTISGPLTGTLTLTDNALNNAASTQTVQLSGTGSQLVQTITFPTIPTQTYGGAPVTLNASASSNLPGSYTVISGPASVTGNLLTITGVGSVTVQASQAGNNQYAPAVPVSQTFTVNQAATTVVWSNPVAITCGTPLSATQLNATATPVGAGTYSYTPAAGTVLNVGSQTLSVQFTPSNSNYAPSIASVTLQVNQASQAITFPPIPNQTYGAGPLTLNATATSGLSVSYTVTSGPAAVSGNMLTLTGVGSVTVQATQAGNGNYAAATAVSQSFTVGKGSQTITFTQSAPKTAPYNSSFTVATTASSGLPVSFSGSGVCTNVGATFTMGSSAGACTVTASQAGNVNYLAAATVTQTTTATKVAPTVTFTGAPATAPYQSTFTVVATSNSGIAPTITAAGACSISGTTVTITIGVGTCTMTAAWAANNYYQAVSVKQTTTATKVAPTVTFTGAPATAPYQSTFAVVATTNSGITPKITVAGPCSISGTAVTITIGTGTCATTANWAANNYYLASSVTQTTTAEKLASIITWPTPVAITYGTKLSAAQLDATANAAGGFTYSPPAGTVLSAGSHSLNTTFSPAQGNDYTTATASVVLQVNQAKPIVTWPTPAPIVYGTALSAKQLDATANVAGTFAYSPNAGTVVNGGSQILSVQFTPSSSNYAPSVVSVTLQVNQANQTITFPPISNQSSEAGPVTLNAFTSSGLPVSYVVTSGPATVSGNMLTLTGVGSVTVQATQAGNTSYAAATPVSQAFLSVMGQGNQFEHIVIVDQENRTPDNLFGSNPTFEPGVDIATSGVNSSGQNVPFTSVELANCYDLGHAHADFHVAYDNGAMDGFNKEPVGPTLTGCVVGPNPQFRYVDNSSGTVQPYFDLATQYGFANRMFQSNQGPSFPSHQFLISGTSAPTTASTLFAADNPNSAGCQSPAGTTVDMIDPNGVYSKMYPCFNHATLIDLLEGAGLTWRYYAAKAGSIWNAPNAISALCNAQTVNGTLTCTGSQWANVILKPPQVLTDIKNCQLANVAWVTPTGQNSDHAVSNTGGGPSWVASIVNAIGNSTCGYWQNTAILITWDDWGGWYDHVPPYQIGQSNGWGQSYVYGFRVPLLVVSAYTPAGYVSNANHDFGSTLRFVETNFGLGLIGPGTWADSYADDLMEFFPLGSPKGFNAIQAEHDEDHFINSTEPATDPDND